MDPHAPGPSPFPGQTPAHKAERVAANGAVIKRRAPIACRRCRRMRSKCLHDKAQPPCKACLEAGLGAQDCIFTARGIPDDDRDFRRPRTRTVRAGKHAPSRAARPSINSYSARASDTPHAADEWLSLPPLDDLIDGVNRFTRYYFQLGFIPRQQYPERLRADFRSANVFLLLSILSISARLSPPLSRYYGGGMEAAKYFTNRASALALHEIYEEPTLERCQAFYLLSIAQQGSGDSNKSYINMGISLRMAALMRLHREETYRIDNPTPDSIIRAESARRTLWMLHSQDSLHSGPLSPVSLAAADITALLPCNEDDFAAGRAPPSRAALHDTPPATERPDLIRDPGRSLFASLMQVHHFWGVVGRRAVGFAHTTWPWEVGSEFSRMMVRLGDWERGLPLEHQWSHDLLRTHKMHGQDLAYLGVTMMPRLCNIVLRRPYLIDIITLNTKDPTRQAYFSNLALDLFRNVRDLFEQIDAQFSGRDPDESVGAQMAAFCVYSCGLFSAYLCKYPHICSQDPSLARSGPTMLRRTIAILMECKEVWPLASRWVDSLHRFSSDPHAAWTSSGATMADGKDPVPHHALRVRQSPSPSGARVGGSSRSDSYSTVRSSQNGMMTPVSSEATSFSQQLQPPHAQQSVFIPPHNPYPTPQMYMAPLRHSSSQPGDDQGIIIQDFEAQNSHAAPQQGPAPYAIDAGARYYPPLGPNTDGFDGELQFYFDGSGSLEPSDSWAGGF